MLTLAVRAHDVGTKISPVELAKKIAETNITSIQFALGISYPEYASAAVLSPGLGSQLKNIFEDEKITISVLSCYINLIHPDLEEREKRLHQFETYIRYASMFGAKIVATETGSIYETIYYSEDNYTEEAYEEVLFSVRRLCREAEKYGIIVGIEPGINHPIHTIEKMQRLIDEVASTNLGIILDPTNLIRVDIDKTYLEIVEEAFECFGEKIVAFHLKDFIIRNQKIFPVAIGEGQVPLKETIQFLNKHKPGLFTIFEETPFEKIASAYQKVSQYHSI
ncbi:sugar phosphate isomerase/epimerase family protein [Enterococcus faecalis]|uniref:sugar phosphate isomerase/epimerase family protein n=1 Tax=Enterococcus faecalis TaxID=1351 RepID=UPI00232C913F|nr:sugar phosphate isomerase/epimerase family protein [Enterococcus faecalis]MDB1590283.1 sugar phosphate isomerase/epimerase [Enterococcus faecalis]MDB1597945.1 sugar phosphate isomerase/epimerase [Enterococcus faecalis]MDB1604625.1 sugar phosphate isomerase/epimerase [Enterococcus faecalis]MDB1608407.1 sugar phosphate isomerase/epimerase [Enterococcus faecalis]MDB1610906.1 sugar phosphate isomerase/epimerase [Enterococcus faecalis]